MGSKNLRGCLFPVLLLLAACSQSIQVRDETSRAPLPETGYLEAASSGARVYRILPQESLILVHVGRAGTMARLGHDHAIASEDVQGFVEISDDRSASRADVALPLRNLIVDKPAYRERLSLETEPSATDIAGTYSNMLKVLEPEPYPWVAVHARIASADANQAMLSVAVTLHGVASDYLVPVELVIQPNRIEVSGKASIRHQEFGLTPFSAVGGLLRVADELEVEFHLIGASLAGG